MNDKDLLQSNSTPLSLPNDNANLLQEQSSLINNISASRDEEVHKDDASYTQSYEKKSQEHMDNVREALAAARARGDYGTRIEINGEPITQDMTYLTTPARLPEDVYKQLEEDNKKS
ncbi:hypothetical protein IT409_02705 [Candidatus Falkowbacteria bacterium]|nr:hypothetical protein [Candidatus Falkowbacteria bacterium]